MTSRNERDRPWPLPRWFVAMLLAAVAVVAGWQSGSATAAALAGGLMMTGGVIAGLALARLSLKRTGGIAGVAMTVVDEAVRMKATRVLLVLMIGLVPVLPLALDPAERLAHRIPFLISWSLSGMGLILGLLTICLACGSVGGDITSGRIHMTLAKPLARWEYLLGKWLGVVSYVLVLVIIAGIGVYALVRIVAAGTAVDPLDRLAVERQVLVARREVPPEPAQPEEYAAAIQAAIARLEVDSPELFSGAPAATRRRIEQEYERQWHTVAPGMETTFVFAEAGSASRAFGEIQLQVDPRVMDLDVDLTDVRLAIWLNGRPWPVQQGRQVEQALPSRARHVFDLPAEQVGESNDLSVRIVNRNRVPAGETRSAAIAFPPGDGMKLLVRVGGFEGNFLRCLVLLWAKLALIAAAGVAAGAVFELPSAILATLVLSAGAVGSDFLRDALGTYNVVADTGWERALERVKLAAGLLQGQRVYEAFRMLLGFLTDLMLVILPSFSADAAVERLAGGVAIPWRDVLLRVLMFLLLYPLVLGVAAGLVFDRRDLVRGTP